LHSSRSRLSVRLFGNVFGGENLLHGTGFFFVFYFMELLVGLIQALVFTLLSLRLHRPNLQSRR